MRSLEGRKRGPGYQGKLTDKQHDPKSSNRAYNEIEKLYATKNSGLAKFITSLNANKKKQFSSIFLELQRLSLVSKFVY